MRRCILNVIQSYLSDWNDLPPGPNATLEKEAKILTAWTNLQLRLANLREMSPAERRRTEQLYLESPELQARWRKK